MRRTKQTLPALPTLCAAIAAILLVGCTDSASELPTSSQQAPTTPLVAGAIPDRDPEEVQRSATKIAAYLEEKLEVPVEYQPVTNYAAAVTAFKVGDLDLVWFGGLTGVQARLQVPGARAIAQRDIDARFRSVFIANTGSGIEPFEDLAGLAALAGQTFTFGSESSTSGRLMPQYFLQQAGVELADFRGEPGFSGNHDATIALVEAGTFAAGALNAQVWEARVAAGGVDTDKVRLVWQTPPYFDYHWVVNPELDARYGAGFTEKLQATLIALDPEIPAEKEILDLFGAGRFIPTTDANYAEIEAVGREIGKIR